MTDFRSATPRDVWPGPAGCPHPPAIQEEIFRVAKEEISWDDVEQSRLGLAPWYVRFHLAEQRVLAAPPKQRETEIDRLKRRVDELETRLEYHTDRINRTLDRISDEYVDADTLLEIVNEHLTPDLDVDVLHDGERGVCFRVKNGDQYKHYPIHLPIPLDRGTFQAGQTYTKGDCVSFGGQIWIAQVDTTEKPGGNEYWRLAVRRGKDAK